MRKHHIYSALYLFILFLIWSASHQVFFSSPFFIPMLILLFVISFALHKGFVETLWMSFFAGILGELVSTLFFGAILFATLIVGAGIYLSTRNLTAQEIRFPLMVVMVSGSTAVFYLIVYGFHSIAAALDLSYAIQAGDYFSFKMLITVVLNLVVFGPINWIYKLIPGRDEEPFHT